MLRIKDKLKEWRYLPGLSKAWIGLLLKLVTYPLDYYLHNSTFIVPPGTYSESKNLHSEILILRSSHRFTDSIPYLAGYIGWNVTAW